MLHKDIFEQMPVIIKAALLRGGAWELCERRGVFMSQQGLSIEAPALY